MKDFQKAVDHALIDRDMRRTDLAKVLGITDAYLSDILNGNRTSQPQVDKIKKYLKLEGDFDV